MTLALPVTVSATGLENTTSSAKCASTSSTSRAFQFLAHCSPENTCLLSGHLSTPSLAYDLRRTAIPFEHLKRATTLTKEEVATLPVGVGSHLLVKVHVEDSNHLPATDGSALYEVCRWKGVSLTTGTRGGAAPSARCADGSARWERLI